MKIAHINMFYHPTFGGVEQVMYELAQRQVKAGHEVHVFCCDSDKYNRIEKKEELVEGVHVHRYPYWFRLSLSTFIWPSLLWKLPKYNFDILHTHVSGHAYVLITGLVSWFKKSKHVHTTHCPWTDAFRSWKLKIPLFLNDLIFNKISFKFIDKIVSITPWEIETLKKWVEEDKIQVIPNGMDSLLYKKVIPNKIKKKFKSKIVLFFGRLNPTKGPDKLALVARNIVKIRKDINFLFAGPDEGMKNKVSRIIKGVERINLLGPVKGKEKVAELYQAADVYVLPSYREGLPLTLFEAMANSLPIVASPVNGIPYVMKDPENGFLVDYGDLKNLKKKILEILDNPTLAKKIGRNNKVKSKKYNWDIIAKDYEKLYRDILN